MAIKEFRFVLVCFFYSRKRLVNVLFVSVLLWNEVNSDLFSSYFSKSAPTGADLKRLPDPLATLMLAKLATFPPGPKRLVACLNKVKNKIKL